MERDSAMSRGRVLLSLGAVVAAVMAVTVWVGATAGAHLPATFKFPNGGNTEVKSFPDGTGTQAHQVIVDPKLGEVTCDGVTLTGTVQGTVTTGIKFKGIFEKCTFLGEQYFVQMWGCEFVLNANGEFTITSAAGKDCKQEPIRIATEKTGFCELIIPEQSLSGVTYTNQSNEVTVSLSLEKIAGDRENCEGAMGKFDDGKYTTGNMVLRGLADPAGAQRPMSWSATVP
jgi:hypothetical protein